MAEQIVFTSEPTGPDAPEDTSKEGQNESQSQNQNEANDEGTGDRPDWLPENFKSPEDFRKSYDDTRAELTKLQQERAEAAKKAAESKEGEEGDGDGKDGKGDDKGNSDAPDISKLTEEDVAEYSKELAETREISEESRAKLKEIVNAPDWMLDTYIAGVKAQNDAANSAIVNAFGGEEAQTEVMGWAGQNLSDSEMATLNKQFESGDMGTVLFAIDALKGKYEAANGKAPSRKLGGNQNVSNTATYTSWDQVNKDMADPKYHSDPAFRAQVKEKLRNFNG